MANDTVKSLSITNLDSTPVIENNAGQGQPGRAFMVDDYCTTTAAGLQSVGSYYKLCRFPTGATIKSVVLATDAAINANGALALSLGVIFSDSTLDGTPSFLQGLIPTSGNTGGTTTLASPSSPNNIYGIVAPTAAAKLAPTEEVMNGLGTNYALTGSGPGAGFFNQPLWQILGFTDGRGEPSDPGGYFDLYAYVATAATTGAAGNIYARVTYAM